VVQVGVIVTPRVWLKGFNMTTYITQGAPLFSGSPLLITPINCACYGAILGWAIPWEVSQATCERERSM